MLSLNELFWGRLILTIINLLAQQEKFQHTWISHHKVLQMSFMSRLFLIPYINMGYKASIPPRKKRELFSRRNPFGLRFVQKEFCLVFF